MTSHTNSKHHNRCLGRLDRTLHLVDLENLAGGPLVTPSQAVKLAEAFARRARYAPGDLMVVGSSHMSGIAASLAFPSATVRWRSGPNGADLALLEAVTEFDLDRFDRLVLGSGDGIFTELAATARAHGVRVHGVSRHESMARSLAQVCDRISLLPYLMAA